MGNDENIEEVGKLKFFLQKLHHLISDSNCLIDIQRKRREEDPLDPNNTNNTIIDLGYDRHRVTVIFHPKCTTFK